MLYSAMLIDFPNSRECSKGECSIISLFHVLSNALKAYREYNSGRHVPNMNKFFNGLLMER